MGLPTLQEPVSHRHRKRGHFRLPLSIVSAVGVILFLQFSILPRYISRSSPEALAVSQLQLQRLDAGLAKCAEFNAPVVQYEKPVSAARENSRWNSKSGQNDTIMLRNATLFDGESFVKGPVDIVFKKGVVVSVMPASSTEVEGMTLIDLGGRFVTPGLVDMHSHHLDGGWPILKATSDENEMSTKAWGPLTPFVRALDSMHAYDIATTIIASGGVTSSLILPGSANIMGGEGFMVKNILRSGPNGEEVVEEILLEHGIPVKERRRYMKMACGENPQGLYGHTRMGNAFILREQMATAEDLRQKQDMWCKTAIAARSSGDSDAVARLTVSGGLPESLKLDSSVAMLRGKIGINVHCYETEDMWDMIQHSKEFGFRIQAFHHALEAWKVPEMLKDSGENITVATFSDFSLYKKEAYGANLYAGKILAEHGVPIAYKSDHGEEQTNAKYLLFQAANGHAFGLPADLALQSVTSVPAKSLKMDHRIGYLRPGYDADIAVWDSHPLSLGATPLQVYIDGKATLDPVQVKKSQSKVKLQNTKIQESPVSRPTLDTVVKEELCQNVETPGSKVVITGITRSYLGLSKTKSSSSGNHTMVMTGGEISCFGIHDECLSASKGGIIIELKNGHVLPGLTAMTVNLGLSEIPSEASTSDGGIPKGDVMDPESVSYAKYGVHLEGRAFKRAKIGGVTRAITPPLIDTWSEQKSFLNGVSVGIKTSEKKTLLDGGIFKDDVALHVTIGQDSKSEQFPSISSAIAKLRKLLTSSAGKDTIYGRVANGTFPLIITVENKYDIMQLIKIKQDYPGINMVLKGGAGMPFVAEELAAAKIPVILTSHRGAPDSFEKLDTLIGPPLTRSPASILTDAGVTFALAINGFGDPYIHNLPLEAGWVAKYSGLDDDAAVNLVSRNVEKILGLNVDEETRDWVVYEGNPLEFGASVVLAVDGLDKEIVSCWPYSE
ncbi:hypothetical protein BP5796_06693 [Coleophoma crateriformis]|uniref:Amidohydrolase-related domain-containing protein n=1 Tax=Coleophoma crateriformis TaxID=565419 RepID=A0A3D8RP55_9HELO|nr:hypothetical protein BP5796_06693 [Coleophoma crateriformis]